MSKFKIGDRVRVTSNNKVAVGTVKDVFTSEVKNTSIYLVQFDDHESMWKEESLEEFAEPVSHTYEIECLENIVLVRLYELRGETKTEIARGHGHIIHEGALGVAQAASYALKRIYYDISNTEG
jgi:hypothetical protein